MATRPTQRVTTHAGATPVRALREAAKLSLRDLEQRTGINRGVWSAIENGHTFPRTRHLVALAAVYEIPIEGLQYRFVLEYVPEEPRG